MKIATDHGFPKPSFGGSDPNAFDAFKNERDYIAQGGRMNSTVAAMEWAVGEIERLRAALKPFADVGRKLRDARVCETGAIPAGASARFLKLEPLIAGDFVQAVDAFDNEQSS